MERQPPTPGRAQNRAAIPPTADPYPALWRLVLEGARKLKPEAFVNFPEVDQDTRVWHYTSAAGLIGVLQRGELWASGLYEMNDPEEGEYGHALLQRVWDDVRPLVNDDSLIEAIESVLQMQTVERTLNQMHIFSTSLSDDALPLWQYYGREDGYAIGFAAGALERLAIRDSAPDPALTDAYPRLWWMPVIYDQVQQRALARELLAFMVENAPTPERWDAEAAQKLGVAEDLAEAVVKWAWVDARALFVRLFAASVKHPAFAHEREMRLVVDQVRPSERDYRELGGRLIPFVRLAEHHEAAGSGFVIDEVRCGPSTARESERTVSAMLTTYGYTTNVVSRSNIPFRP